MRPLTGQVERAVADIACVPVVGHGARARIQRGDGRAERLERLVDEIDAVAMRGRRDADDIIRGPAGFAHGFLDRIRGRGPEAVHVPLDMARLGDKLRNAPAGDRQFRAVGVEDHRLGDGQATIDP